MHHIVVFFFIIASSCNTLLIKWTNTLKGESSDGKLRYFQHPVALTFLMFLGEFICFLIFKATYCFLRRRNDGSEDLNLLTGGDRGFRPFSMLLPACLNAVTTVIYLSGLYLTYASSFQAIRCSTLVFVGFLASIHLNQQLNSRHWWAMFVIASGITIIIATDMRRVVHDNSHLAHANPNAVLSGDLLIVCASIFKAAKIVYEEKYLKACRVPILQAIGWQGIFGLLITSILVICANFMPTPISPFNDSSHTVFDDLQDILYQLQSNSWLIVAICTYICTTAIHGFTALCIITFSSSANLILADGIQTYLVLLIACLLDWEKVNFILLIGYLLLQLGLITYRRAILMEWYRSILLYFTRVHYVDVSADPSGGPDGGAVPSNRPADII